MITSTFVDDFFSFSISFDNAVDAVDVVVIVVELTTAPTVDVSCPDFEIPGRSGFAFHGFNNFKALMRLGAIR